MTTLALALALLAWSTLAGLPTPAAAAGPSGDCSSERGLEGRSDVVFCEPWENSAWWQTGYVTDGSKTQPRPVTAERVARTSVVSSGCVAGRCLEVDMRRGEAGALAVHGPRCGAGQQPQGRFFRYYL